MYENPDKGSDWDSFFDVLIIQAAKPIVDAPFINHVSPFDSSDIRDHLDSMLQRVIRLFADDDGDTDDTDWKKNYSQNVLDKFGE
jgi:hypothetical protein